MDSELHRRAFKILWAHTTLAYFTVETGEKIGHLEWKQDVLQETGADFLLMAVRFPAINTIHSS